MNVYKRMNGGDGKWKIFESLVRHVDEKRMVDIPNLQPKVIVEKKDEEKFQPVERV
jgi:hypothetical protein